jgi:hypothetical protein
MGEYSAADALHDGGLPPGSPDHRAGRRQLWLVRHKLANIVPEWTVPPADRKVIMSQVGAPRERRLGATGQQSAAMPHSAPLEQVPTDVNRKGIHNQLWRCDSDPLDLGGQDDESVFGGSARAGDRGGRSRGDAASGGGPVQGERQFGDPLSAALADGLGNRGQAARRQRLAAGGSRGGTNWLGGRTTGPDAG